jgi:hypothetical protein
MSNSWWADKLGNQQAPAQRPASQPYAAPPSYPSQTPPPIAQATAEGHRLPASATSYDRCPNCASGNYGKMPGMPEAKARCYDCGYPITQSGTGMPGMHIPSNGNTEAAKQISTNNNFNPGTIIDRIG